MENRTFVKGEVIAKRGTFTEGLYQVVKGKCMIQYEVGERTLGFPIKTGDVFGEVGLILGTVTGCTLLSHSSQTVIRIITHKHINECLAKDPQLGAKLFLFTAKTLRSRFLRIQQNLLLHKSTNILNDADNDNSPRSPRIPRTLNAKKEKIKLRRTKSSSKKHNMK